MGAIVERLCGVAVGARRPEGLEVYMAQRTYCDLDRMVRHLALDVTDPSSAINSLKGMDTKQVCFWLPECLSWEYVRTGLVHRARDFGRSGRWDYLFYMTPEGVWWVADVGMGSWREADELMMGKI